MKPSHWLRCLLVGTLGVSLTLVGTSAIAASLPVKVYSILHWRGIGPFRGGRSLAVAGDPTTPSTFYAGFTGGGIWKTTDNGEQWTLVTGSHFAFGSVGALAVAPSNPNIIYAGTGEGAIRGDMATGNGVYKSTDAGKTWKHVGLDATHVIARIVIDPQDPKIVYAAALGHVFGPNPQRGIYKTTDGGEHWQKILYVNNKTGAIDIAMDPHDPKVLYAAMWQACRRPWTFSSGGPGSGLYKSKDGGAHWTNISRHPGLPSGILGKIGVSVSGADPNVVYAVIQAKGGGVYRSNNAGATWTRVNHKDYLTQRGWYFSRIVADPKNVDTVYAPEVGGIWKSTDGGHSFKVIKVPSVDSHMVWVNPRNPKIMVLAADRGATVSLDGGRSWSPAHQVTGQFYHVSLDNRFPFHVYGAAQDNSPIEVASGGPHGVGPSQTWTAAGSESGYVVPEPGQPWITYGGGMDGQIYMLNRRIGYRQDLNAWPDYPMGHGPEHLKYRFQWTFPLMISKFPPHDVYIGSQYVMRSNNGGMNWSVISPDLTRDLKDKLQPAGGPIDKDDTGVEYYDTLFALAQSPLSQNVLWAGSDDGLVHVTQDGGKDWQIVTPKGLPKLITIGTIEPSHFDPACAFLAARRYLQDDFKPYLYKTCDYGEHWTEITNGLPDNQSSFVIRQDIRDKNLLFAGTLHGVYLSFDSGNHWQPFQLNLPSVPVRDMAIQPRADALIIATHGLGFWVLDSLQPLREMAQQVAGSTTTLFAPAAIYLTGWRNRRRGTPRQFGENRPGGVVVYYNLSGKLPRNKAVSLTFLTSNGKVIASFSNQTGADGGPVGHNKRSDRSESFGKAHAVGVKAGMNRFVWDMRYPTPIRVPGAPLSIGFPLGPYIVPGAYQVRLTVNGQSQTRRFKVMKNPDIPATQADLEAQLVLLQAIDAKLSETDSAILRVRKMLDRVESYEHQFKNGDHAEFAQQSAQIANKLTHIEDALIQSKSHSSEDIVRYPIRLNDKLATLAEIAGTNLQRPTAQDQQVYQLLATQVDAQLQAFHTILQVELPRLNQAISRSGEPPHVEPPEK